MANYQSAYTGAQIDAAVAFTQAPYTDVSSKVTLNNVSTFRKYVTLDAAGWVKCYLNGVTSAALSVYGTAIATLDSSIAPSNANGVWWRAVYPDNIRIENGQINYYPPSDVPSGSITMINTLLMWKVAT